MILPLGLAGILEQSVEARNRVVIGLLNWPARLRKAGGIDSLESIPGLLKSWKYRLRGCHMSVVINDFHAKIEI